ATFRDPPPQLLRAAIPIRIYPDGGAAQEPGGIDPRKGFLNCRVPGALLGGTERAVGIDHDEVAFDPLSIGAALQVTQVSLVPSLVREKLVHELDSRNIEVPAGDP